MTTSVSGSCAGLRGISCAMPSMQTSFMPAAACTHSIAVPGERRDEHCVAHGTRKPENSASPSSTWACGSASEHRRRRKRCQLPSRRAVHPVRPAHPGIAVMQRTAMLSDEHVCHAAIRCVRPSPCPTLPITTTTTVESLAPPQLRYIPRRLALISGYSTPGSTRGARATDPITDAWRSCGSA